jgi:hypothetical protein
MYYSFNRFGEKISNNYFYFTQYITQLKIEYCYNSIALLKESELFINFTLKKYLVTIFHWNVNIL